MPILVRDNRGGNWFWMHNAIITQFGARLGPYAISVYAALCCHADRDAQSTWVGQRALAEELGFSRRQVQRELDKLRDLGLLEIDEQHDEHGRTTNVYTLLALPLDSQTRGNATQTPAHSPPVASPRLPGAPINKTHESRLEEQVRDRSELRVAWQTTSEHLAQEMTLPNYQRWIAPLHLIELDDSHAVLLAPDTAVANYVGLRLAERLARALHVPRIEVQIHEAHSH